MSLRRTVETFVEWMMEPHIAFPPFKSYDVTIYMKPLYIGSALTEHFFQYFNKLNTKFLLIFDLAPPVIV